MALKGLLGIDERENTKLLDVRIKRLTVACMIWTLHQIAPHTVRASQIEPVDNAITLHQWHQT